jgi:uncharacterized protein DUF4145
MPLYISPSFRLAAFNCPVCSAFARQNWQPLFRQTPNTSQMQILPRLWSAECDHCKQLSIWLDEKMVFPTVSTAPLANADLPSDVKEDYEEAREILSRSPRGAAALVRLSVQKLCKSLGEKGDNINADIAGLVKKGLPLRVQQALDAVRVIGNNAVHPGLIDITDDPETAARLFELVNIVCDYMITQPRRVEEIYSKLPAPLLEAIDKRDKP